MAYSETLCAGDELGLNETATILGPAIAHAAAQATDTGPDRGDDIDFARRAQMPGAD